MCESLKMQEADLISLATEYQHLEAERDGFNIGVLKHVNDDIILLEEELSLKKQRMAGLEEDFEEATEIAEAYEEEKAEVEQRLEALQERLDFYDNQMESWEGRMKEEGEGSDFEEEEEEEEEGGEEGEDSD